jgi:hypothetical protein
MSHGQSFDFFPADTVRFEQGEDSRAVLGATYAQGNHRQIIRAYDAEWITPADCISLSNCASSFTLSV